MALQKIGVEAVIEGLSSFRRGIDGMGNDVGGFGDKVSGVGGNLTAFGDKLVNIGTIAAGAVVAGLAAATTAVVAFAGKGVVAAKDMEQSLADIAAVLNTTKDEIQPLSDLIVELGLDPNLKVTAEEAAAAIELLARNGLSMTEIIDGAARSTVLLANATGADFGNAANIATDAMAIFGIEAANMGDAVNGIVSVTTSSKFTIDDYALALAQGGGVAAAAGVEFDDFNASIAAISPLFRSGSDAGTSFKTFITRLIPTTEKAKDAMSELGLIAFNNQEAFDFLTQHGIEPATASTGDLSNAMADYFTATTGLELGTKKGQDAFEEFLTSAGILQNQFFNTNGEMKDMAEIADALQVAFADLTEQQKTEALQTIFGTDAMRAAVGLAEIGGEAFQGLADAMGETDAASQAATRMDTLAGTLEVISGVIETVQLQIGQAFLPILRQLAERLLVLADEVGPIVTAFFDSIATFITSFFGDIQSGMPFIIALKNALYEAFPQEIALQIINFVDLINNLIRGFENLFVVQEFFEDDPPWLVSLKNFGDIVRPIIQSIFEMVTNFVSWKDVLIVLAGIIVATVLPALAGLIASIAAVALPITAAIAVVALLRTAWEENWGGIQEKTAVAIEFVQTIIQTALAAIQEFWLAHGEQIMATVTTIWEGIQSYFSLVWENIKAVFNAFKAAFEGDWHSFGEQLRVIWDNTWQVITTVLKTVGDTILKNIAEFILNIISKFEDTDWQSVGKAIIEGIANGISSAVDFIKEAATNAAQAAFEAAKGFLGIDSPSKLAAQFIGLPFTEGIAVGIDQPNIIDSAIGNLFSQAIPQTTAAMQPVTNSFGGATNVDNGRSVDVSFGDTINNTPFDVVMFQEFILNTVRDAVDL